jgi:hypothetical protein
VSADEVMVAALALALVLALVPAAAASEVSSSLGRVSAELS